MGAVRGPFQRECCCSASDWLFFEKNTDARIYFLVAGPICSDPPVLDDLPRRRLGGCRRWREQRGSLCSVCHRGKLLAPARETACEVSASARHVDSGSRQACARSCPRSSRQTDQITPLLKRRLRRTTPSTLSGVWMRAGVPITCPEMSSTLRSQTSLFERRTLKPQVAGSN